MGVLYGTQYIRKKMWRACFYTPKLPTRQQALSSTTARIKGCIFHTNCSLTVDKLISKYTHAIDTHTTESSRINFKERSRQIHQRLYTEDMKQTTAAKHCGNSQKIPHICTYIPFTVV